MIPIFIFQTWLLGLVSLGLLGGGVYATKEWYERSWAWHAARHQSVFSPEFGWNADTALLLTATLLLATAFFGRSLVKISIRMIRRRGASEEEVQLRTPDSVHVLHRPDGSKIHVECFGPETGIPVILCHGWTLDGSAWKYFLRSASDGFRLIVWDQPGLGRSTRPSNRDYSLEKLAGDLGAVLALAQGRPAILVGHSIGGMIVLTFCRDHQTDLKDRVAGLVLTHTTPTDPVRTTSGAAFYTAIERPVLVPLMYVTIALSPLLWLLNWLGYRNGLAHVSAMRSSFAGGESWEQIDFAARFQLKAAPAVVARGMLGMMRYDASACLDKIHFPCLVVAADRDKTTKPEASLWLASEIPGAQLVSLSPARHLGFLEHNNRYTGIVCSFANTCAAGQADGAHAGGPGAATPPPAAVSD